MSPFDEVTIPGTTITSPNYPFNYDEYDDCQLKIKFATNAIVSLTFEDFNVESSSRCRYDFLAIHDGNSISDPIIASKMCGTIPAGTTVNSTGNAINLHFYSDSYYTTSGFKIYADAIIGKWVVQKS